MTEAPRRARPAHDAAHNHWWRVALVIGALGASVLGGQLISSQETAPRSPGLATTIIIPQREPDGTVVEHRLQLVPVPTAIPRGDVPTIARSRSSR